MSRILPLQNANDYDLGYMKKGSDGNIYIVDENKNNVHSWKKLSPLIAEKNLERLTEKLDWKVISRKFTDIKMFSDDDELIRKITDIEFKTPVLFGKQRIYIGGGWEKNSSVVDEMDVGYPVRYIEIGENNKYTTFKKLLTSMFNEYQKPIKEIEMKELIQRVISQKYKKELINLYKKGKLIFADWLGSHYFFEGSMHKLKTLRKHDNPVTKNMYVFGFGS